MQYTGIVYNYNCIVRWCRLKWQTPGYVCILSCYWWLLSCYVAMPRKDRPQTRPVYFIITKINKVHGFLPWLGVSGIFLPRVYYAIHWHVFQPPSLGMWRLICLSVLYDKLQLLNLYFVWYDCHCQTTLFVKRLCIRSFPFHVMFYNVKIILPHCLGLRMLPCLCVIDIYD